MERNLDVVAILAVGLAFASFLAYTAQRLKLPSILGFLLAGFLIGPFSPGYVADLKLAEQLAEIGVVLMLFSVGMHFKLEDLMGVKNIAIPGAVCQTLAATVLATALIYSFGWTLEAGVMVGLAIGVASTVVLVRVLTDNHLLNTPQGHIAVGWLVVEDIFTVVILILLPALASFSGGLPPSFGELLTTFLFVIGKFTLLVFFMFTWGHQLVRYILTNVARLRSQELFTLTMMALIFVIAVGSSVLFGTSMALGAFIAGMVIGQTEVRHQALANSLPLKDIFAIIFFLTVGMLFNPAAIVENLYLFLGILGIILIIKPLVAYLITIFFKYPAAVALTVAFSLAQIGEFSFILAEEAMRLKLLPDEGYDLLVACAIVSISLNPLLFYFVEPLAGLFKTPQDLLKNDWKKSETLQKAVVVGFGPIGKEAAEIVKEAGVTPLIIEHNIDTVTTFADDHSILYGDATQADILKEAHLAEADYLIITIPDTAKAIEIVHAARQIHPDIQILMRIRYMNEQPLIEGLNVKSICTEEEALLGFAHLVRHLFKPLRSL